MKKKNLVLIALLLFINQAIAERIPGYYISNSNDTTKVVFNIPIKLLAQEPNIEKLQKKIKYYDSNNKKMVLKPEMAKEVAFIYRGKRTRMLSKNDELGLNGVFSKSNKIFLHLIRDGKLKLFEYHFTRSGGGGFTVGAGGTMTMAPGGGASPASKYILQKGNGILYETKSGWWLSFREDMSSYFSDCPELAKKIKEKVYKKDDLEFIVDEYNIKCK